MNAEYILFPFIHNAEALGRYHLGNPNHAVHIVSNPIDRAEYGRRLADMEGGIFTDKG
ncbi:MAG: hypothetical protein LBU32_07045 [Clostridiales bacterium]|jgi:hypothetical protein|nr:hypothetical protein [Clostridiales bacterium]